MNLRLMFGILGIVVLFSFCEIVFFGRPSHNQGVKNKLTVGVPNPIESLSPLTAVTVQEKYMLPLIFDNLFIENENGEIEAMLAKSWSYSPTDHILKIEMHNSKFFSDGLEVESKHIVNTIKYFCNSETRLQGWMVGIKGCLDDKNPDVWSTGKYTFSISLLIDPSAFLYQLASSASLVLNIKSHDVILGVGPYRVKSLKDSILILEQNPYNLNSISLRYQVIEFHHVPESAVKQALQSNVYDVLSMYLSSANNNAVSGYDVINYAPRVSQLLILNPQIIPFIDKKTRKRLANDIENTDFSVCQPHSVKAFGVIPKGVGGSFSERKSIESKRVESSISQSYSNHMTLHLYRHRERYNLCEENYLKEIFQRSKINLVIDYIGSYKDLIPLYLSNETSGYIEMFVFGSRDPYQILKYLDISSDHNFFHYESNQISMNLKAALDSKKISERFRIYKMINKELYENYNVLPLYYTGHVNIVRDQLETIDTNGYLYNPNSFLRLIQL